MSCMKSLTEHAMAKLNLTLDVGARRDDGYHEMRMVMQTVDLSDEVEITLTEGGEIRLRTNLRYLPSDGRNLAAKAARTFFDAAALPGAGAEIRLRKRIPVCAGLGGGSADAAAVLRGLNTLTGAGFSPERLEEIGRALGSDVPFCVRGGTQLATGRGDELSPLAAAPVIPAVICKPGFSVSTPTLFQRIDSRRSGMHPDTEGMLAAIDAGDARGVAQRVYNVFEDALPVHRLRTVQEIKRRLIDAGALGAAMTGTGSAVFGLFPDEETAKAAHMALSATWRDCFLTLPAQSVV